MRTRPAAIAIVSLCAAAAAGCGATTVHHVTTTITRSATTPTSSTTSASTSTATTSGAPTSSTTSASSTASTTSTGSSTPSAAGASSLSRRSPQAILRGAADALRRAGGYAMRADLLQNRRRTVIDVSANGSRRYEASLTTAATSFSLVALPGSAYLRGNQAFWRTQLAAGGRALARTRARTLAGHWLHVPSSGARSVTRSLGTLAPGTLARCLTEDHGTLTLAGHTTIGHARALVVRDAGNAPGATPSTIAVAARGTPYPLRYDATGATRRGGRVDVCNDGKGDGATGTIELSQFGRTPTVQAPSGASAGGAQT